MRRFVRSAALCHLAAGAALVLGTAAPLRAEWQPAWRARRPCPPPCPEAAQTLPPLPQPAPGGEPSPAPRPEPAPAPAPSPFDFGTERGLAGGGGEVALRYPGLKGDQFGLPVVGFAGLLPRGILVLEPGQPQPMPQPMPPTPGRPPQPGQPVVSPPPPQRNVVLFPTDGAQALLAPSIRTFKIAENESPAPEDRVYLDFNYYDNVGAAVSRRFGLDLRDINVYRETFGVEKTFLDGNASVGLRLPLNTLGADSNTPGFGGTDTAVGDLTAILKFALLRDVESGSVLSAGLAVTMPTGPGHFGTSPLPVRRDTFLQPYVGYLFGRDRLFLQGFLAVDVPTDSADATLLFNDVGVGYYLYRNPQGDRLLTGVAPTVELHVNDPLNRRGIFRRSDLDGISDIIDLTVATTFDLGERSHLSVGVVTPLTGPKPFDFEVLVQFNWNFGRRGVGGPTRLAGGY